MPNFNEVPFRQLQGTSRILNREIRDVNELLSARNRGSEDGSAGRDQTCRHPTARSRAGVIGRRLTWYAEIECRGTPFRLLP